MGRDKKQTISGGSTDQLEGDVPGKDGSCSINYLAGYVGDGAKDTRDNATNSAIFDWIQVVNVQDTFGHQHHSALDLVALVK